MSGGHFDYEQYKLEQIADSIERIIEGNKKEVAEPPPETAVNVGPAP